MEEKSLEEQIKIKAQSARKLARYMSSTQELVENQILKAQEKGAFENLEGAGKPLHFEDNPYENPEWRMVIKILKDNDCAPYWIELGKEIDADLEKFHRNIESFQKYTRIFYGQKRNKMAVERFEKKKASLFFEERIRLNAVRKKILDYNLVCPSFQMGRPNLNVDDEMYKVISAVEKLIEDLISSQA